ncbi:MAG: type III-A CRISPR-associated RAMP protein Csm5 [Thermodesulfovibrionales bacterium]|nr:type III-A CRISPR-associated RAMP protein Csm5 [Thermodesulfovibrionales bacterium]
MPNYKYEIEVLTSLHIGSGEKIYPLEYVIDKEFIRVNMDKLFAEPSFQREMFIRESKKRDFYLGAFDKNNSLKYPLYKTAIALSTASELTNNIGTPNALVLNFIKEGKNFYIPGSSLKGAIRTAMLWNFLQEANIRSEFEGSLKKELARKKDPKEGRRVKRERFSLSSEEAILGRPNYSLLKALHAGDSDFLLPSSISVEVSRVLSKTGNGFKWKQLGRDGGNTDNPGDATPIFFEAVKSGTKIKGSIKIDEFLLSEEVAAALKLRDITLLKELAKTCNAFAYHHLEKEWNFFKSVGLKEIQDEIERIKKISLTDNEFLLHFAWGSGYEAKALGNTIDKSLFNEIRNEWNLGKRGMEFPKTRKIVFEDGKPKTVTGWVKLKLET